MKRIFLAIAVITVMFSMSGCLEVFTGMTDHASTKDGVIIPKGYGAVRLSFVQGSARTAMPEVTLEALRFEFFFNGDEEPREPEPAEEDGILFLLAPGGYTLTVFAYLIANDEKDETDHIAEGEAAFSIEAEMNEDISVILSPIISDGTGTFIFTINYDGPDSVEVAGFTLSKLFADRGQVELDKDITINEPNTFEVPVGYYLLHVRLYDEDANTYAVRTEVVHIYRNMITETRYDFTPDEFMDGTPGLAYEPIEGEDAYRVRKGIVTGGEVIIPASYNNLSVTEIGYEAFRLCTSLTSVSIPEGVTSIGSYAFYGCTSLASVTFAGTIAGDQFNTSAFPGDLRDKFYEADSANGTSGTYTTSNPGISAVWTRQ